MYMHSGSIVSGESCI